MGWSFNHQTLLYGWKQLRLERQTNLQESPRAEWRQQAEFPLDCFRLH